MQITRYKLRGVMLITTVVAVAAWILLAGGIFLTQSSQFQMLGARKIEEQARQYAEVDAQILKYVAYDKLTDATTLKSYKLHLKRAKMETVEAADWEDEITIGPEKKSSDKSGGYRVATINIYRKGDTKPRWSMDAILVKGSKNSSGSNTGDNPSGEDEEYEFTIIPIPTFPFYTLRGGLPSFKLHTFRYYVYDNTKMHVDRIYPYYSEFNVSASPYRNSSDAPHYNNTGGTSANNKTISPAIVPLLDAWFNKYNAYIKNDIAKKIEDNESYLKTSLLHKDGTANAKILFQTKYVYIWGNYHSDNLDLRNLAGIYPEDTKFEGYYWLTPSKSRIATDTSIPDLSKFK